MKRLIIVGAMLVFGIFMLPACREFLEIMADEFMTGLTGEPYAAFLQLFVDHIYLVTVGLWIVAMAVIVFLPQGEETSEIQRR